MDFGNFMLLIDGGCIVIHVECFKGKSEIVSFSSLGFHTQIEVTGIVPAAYIESGNPVTGLVFRQCRRSLYIAVKMVVIHRCHACVVIVAQIMPYPVLFTHTHVTHLDRKEIFQYRLPYTTVINVAGNTEDRRSAAAVNNLV